MPGYGGWWTSLQSPTSNICRGATWDTASAISADLWRSLMPQRNPKEQMSQLRKCHKEKSQRENQYRARAFSQAHFHSLQKFEGLEDWSHSCLGALRVY